ncbi:MBL fold metallo-hydrolase [Bradyrhizobium brasilense]|uniref:MBL fold metallo-hydrolase n=1 Tax=Bradyrhizobium brasilense TaxID=1419277 RepID=UPI002877F22C|nr:MBL fold metallo-hydrolase [Bradyrhizobium brasilense]MCP3416581.1 MBL fold metallo-hydrolase [Bradyrhizobium brasilense]
MSTSPSTQVAGVYHRRLGDALVTGLSDGYVDMGYTIFRNIPEEETKAILARDHRTSPPRISVNAFAVRMDNRTYLIDCGSADLMGPTCGRLPANLAAAGIDPASVDAVLLTHVHPDHSNGLTDAATGTRLFPNAEVIVHENEINHWFNDEAMAKAAERPRRRYFEAGRTQLKPYMAADRVKTFRKGEVLPGVTAIPIHGHTPGHAAYVVSCGGESMVVWGDTVHVPEIQVARPEVTMEFDTDPEAAAAVRQMMFDMVVTDDMLVGGMHLHFPGFGHMRREAGRYSLVAEQWAFEV